MALSPSIVETYNSLLVHSEIESLGIKGFLNQLLPKVFVQQSWGTLHTLLEIFSYRLYHIQVGGQILEIKYQSIKASLESDL